MFGTMGFSELIIILVIILIIFGAGRLPQIGEGVGKALKGFKKEVSEIPTPTDSTGSESTPLPEHTPAAPSSQTAQPDAPAPSAPNKPYQPGPEMTPGTTAALLYQGAGPQTVTPQTTKNPTQQTQAPSASAPLTMEERQSQPAPIASGQYPPLPKSAQAKPMAKRPSAIVNKQAVARVQAQQAAMKSEKAGLAPQDMQSLGESLGSTVRTFKDAAADIRNSVDPQMRSIQAELEAAEKEMQESIELAKQPLNPKEPSGSA
jgi:TatA/E family protein of Tat protein translocase